MKDFQLVVNLLFLSSLVFDFNIAYKCNIPAEDGLDILTPQINISESQNLRIIFETTSRTSQLLITKVTQLFIQKVLGYGNVEIEEEKIAGDNVSWDKVFMSNDTIE